MKEGAIYEEAAAITGNWRRAHNLRTFSFETEAQLVAAIAELCLRIQNKSRAKRVAKRAKASRTKA